MATQTPNYQFPKYESTDIPDLTDEYNEFADKADAAINQVSMSATNAATAANNAQQAVTTLTEQVTDLDETVGQVASQVVTAQNTAESALSLAQTNESDIADTQSDVTALQSSVASLQSGKAPTDHASVAGTYGTGNASEYGHVKLADVPSSGVSATSGTAATPKGAWDAALEIMTPQDIQLNTPSAGSFVGNVNRAQYWGTLRWLRFTFSLSLPGTSNPDSVTIATCDQVGIPAPAANRTLYAAVSAYIEGTAQGGFNTVGALNVNTDGTITVDGWNTISGTRYDWTSIRSLQAIYDVSDWS